MSYFSFSCANLLHGNCPLTGFNFSIKILFIKLTFWFWILLCYLLNMFLLCIGSISWCCFVVLLLCWCSVLLFYGVLIVSLVFYCSVSVLVFYQYSTALLVFCSSVFWCSWFNSMPPKMWKSINFALLQSTAIYLKLFSTIFYQIFIFHQTTALQELWKMFFI